MLTHYSFHSGQIQSIGFELDGRSVRAGVISTGEYRFQIERPERMTVLQGELQVRRTGEPKFWHCRPGSTFYVSPDTELELRAEEAVAYLCELF